MTMRFSISSAFSLFLTPYVSTESSLVVRRLSANVIARVATWEAEGVFFFRVVVRDYREEVEKKLSIEIKVFFRCLFSLFVRSLTHQRGT